MRPKPWGYKGKETSLNGLTSHILSVKQLTGTTDAQYTAACKLVVEFAQAHVPGYVKRGHLQHTAGYAAKRIQAEGLFVQFYEWLKTHSKP